MFDQNVNNELIKKTLETVKTVAMVGVSSIKEKVDEIGIINQHQQDKEDPAEEEPLILNDEALVLNNKEEEKELNKNQILSPAVRKIVTEKKNKY